MGAARRVDYQRSAVARGEEAGSAGGAGAERGALHETRHALSGAPLGKPMHAEASRSKEAGARRLNRLLDRRAQRVRALGERSQGASIKPDKDRLQRVHAELYEQRAERVGRTGSRNCWLSRGPLWEDGRRVFEIEERERVNYTIHLH